MMRSDDDFRVEWYSGTGNGGQHRNRHMNSCRLIHIPTNTVEQRQGRQRESNLSQAKDAIIKRLDALIHNQNKTHNDAERRQQIGSGMRGDKIRTYRFQDDIVKDHISEKQSSCTKVMKGQVDLLWS
jgi:peptide chain release factor 1